MPKPKYYNSIKLELLYTAQQLSICRSVMCKFQLSTPKIQARTGDFTYKITVLIRISPHYPASGKYDSNTKMSQCCCCDVAKKETVFQPMDRKIRSSSIFLGPISTMDLSNCQLRSHTQPTTKLFSGCAQRKINTEKSVFPLTSFQLFSLDPLYCCQKSFIREFKAKQLQVLELSHWKWWGFLLWS